MDSDRNVKRTFSIVVISSMSTFLLVCFYFYYDKLNNDESDLNQRKKEVIDKKKSVNKNKENFFINDSKRETEEASNEGYKYKREIDNREKELKKRYYVRKNIFESVKTFYAYGNSKKLDKLISCYRFPVKYYDKLKNYNELYEIYQNAWKKVKFSRNEIKNITLTSNRSCLVDIKYTVRRESMRNEIKEFNDTIEFKFDDEFKIISQKKISE